MDEDKEECFVHLGCRSHQFWKHRGTKAGTVNKETKHSDEKEKSHEAPLFTRSIYT